LLGLLHDVESEIHPDGDDDGRAFSEPFEIQNPLYLVTKDIFLKDMNTIFI